MCMDARSGVRRQYRRAARSGRNCAFLLVLVAAPLRFGELLIARIDGGARLAVAARASPRTLTPCWQRRPYCTARREGAYWAPSKKQIRSMAHHITLFRFRLGKGQSIGPSALRKLWVEACGSEDVSVSRVTSNFGTGSEEHTYSLCGSPIIGNLAMVEARMQTLLAKLSPTAAIRLTSL